MTTDYYDGGNIAEAYTNSVDEALEPKINNSFVVHFDLASIFCCDPEKYNSPTAVIKIASDFENRSVHGVRI